TIANLTVANGSTTDSPGGGISMAGGTVTLDHVTVSGNYAWGSSVDSGGSGTGGGLYGAGGTLALDQCTVAGNYAWGGDNYGPFATYASLDGSWGMGGGLYVAGGLVHVNQSTVSSNVAIGGNGASVPPTEMEPYWNYGGNGGSGQGGGIYVAAGKLEL